VELRIISPPLGFFYFSPRGGFFLAMIPAACYSVFMKSLKDILSQFGYITSPQAEELAEHFPCMKVVIQWGGLPRERVMVSEVAKRIKHVEDNDIDYCRSVFITAEQSRKLKEVFAIAD